MNKTISVALVKPPIRDHILRGIGVYISQLYAQLSKDTSITCRLLNMQEALCWGDIVHFGYFDPFFLTLPFRKNKPTIVTIHDMIPLIFPHHFPKGVRGSIKWRIQKYLVRRSNAIITDSYTSQNDINRILDISKQCIFPIYLAADSNFKPIQKKDSLKYLKNKYNLPEKFVLYVGDVNWNKNIPRLIAAIKQINVTLVAVCPSPEAQKVYNNCQMDKRFILLTALSQQDLVALYNLATLCVMPSLYEGFGLPVIEAFQCGCPVVSSNVGSLKEIIGDSAYIVNPYSINNIADGIGEMYFNINLQKKYRARGLKQAKLFSWHKTTKETKRVYEYVLNNI